MTTVQAESPVARHLREIASELDQMAARMRTAALAMRDPRRRFVDAWTVSSPKVRCRSSRLYEAYQAYCAAEGIPCETSPVSFGKALHALGFRSIKSGGVKIWLGITLTDADMTDLRRTPRAPEPPFDQAEKAGGMVVGMVGFSAANMAGLIAARLMDERKEAGP